MVNDNKKKNFKRLREAISSKGKATAELEASKNPQAFVKQNYAASLVGKKGIAG